LGSRRQKNIKGEGANMPITDLKELKDGRPYKVFGGLRNGNIFVYSAGHKRRILTERNFYQYFSDDDLQIVSPGVDEALPFGAPLPLNDNVTLMDLLKEDDTDAIREELCSNFSGTGYEIGAGERPTRVPISVNVFYVDKFTFEEAKDGSFIGKKVDNFVKVSIFEAMDSLNSIEDGTTGFFVACHVIEHVPNVITSLKSIFRKLKDGGEIVLVVPDKRYMFDQGRPDTTFEHFLADEIRGKNAETLEHYIEYFRRAAAEKNYLELALAGFESGRDIHMHVFTPDSMRALLAHLQMELKFQEFIIFEPQHPEILIEFYIRIRK
jgi:hypothetical protein